MKLGILSDIHGEIDNLMQALSILQIRDCEIICLGDLVSEDSFTNDECIELINNNKMITVLGQHDETCIKVNSPPVIPSSLSFLESLPVIHELGNIHIVHDNPLERARKGLGMWNRGSYIKSTLESDVVFEDLDQNHEEFQFFLVGHTHVPKIFSSQEGEIDFDLNTTIQLSKNNRYIINPGRVGGKDRGSAGVTFAYLDTDNYIAEILSI